MKASSQVDPCPTSSPITYLRILCALVLRCLSRQTAKICFQHRLSVRKMSSTVDCQSLASILCIKAYEYACNADNIVANCPVDLHSWYMQVMTVTMAKEQAVALVATPTSISTCRVHSAIHAAVLQDRPQLNMCMLPLVSVLFDAEKAIVPDVVAPPTMQRCSSCQNFVALGAVSTYPVAMAIPRMTKGRSMPNMPTIAIGS